MRISWQDARSLLALLIVATAPISAKVQHMSAGVLPSTTQATAGLLSHGAGIDDNPHRTSLPAVLAAHLTMLLLFCRPW